jgi:hypothetical protein
MAVGLLGGDPPLIDEGLHEGVVLGDLREFTVAKQVTTGVADVDEPEPVAGEQDRGERRPHPVQVGIEIDLLGDGRIPFVDGMFELCQQVAAGLVVIEVGQRGDHQL